MPFIFLNGSRTVKGEKAHGDFPTDPVQMKEQQRYMRIDKYLKNSRLIKRRTVAKEACDTGRITINGKTAKAGNEVQVGDLICVQFGNSMLTAKVTALTESCKKEDAAGMYEIIE